MEFDKLEIDIKRKLILKHIINDEFFKDIINTVKHKYAKYIYEGDELKNTQDKNKQRRVACLLRNELNEYEHAVNKCLSNQSRYKDIVYNVYSTQNTIEKYCMGKYVNGITCGVTILELLISYLESTYDTIYEYGGERWGSEDQTLRHAIKIYLKNPYLSEEIKQTKTFKKYFNKYFNPDENDSDDYIDDNADKKDTFVIKYEYNSDSEDIESDEELDVSEIDDNETDNSESSNINSLSSSED